MGVKHPLIELSKDTKRGGLKKAKKKKAGREEEETLKAGENMVKNDRLRCKSIGSIVC